MAYRSDSIIILIVFLIGVHFFLKLRAQSLYFLLKKLGKGFL